MFMVVWERVAAECSHMKKITAIEASAYPAHSDSSSLQTEPFCFQLHNNFSLTAAPMRSLLGGSGTGSSWTWGGAGVGSS